MFFWKGDQTDLGEAASEESPIVGFLQMIRVQARVGVHFNSRLNQLQEANASAQYASICPVTARDMVADYLRDVACPQSKVACIDAPAPNVLSRSKPLFLTLETGSWLREGSGSPQSIELVRRS